MCYVSYERCMDKSITEVKMYVLLLMKSEQYQEIHDIVNRSIDIKQMQRRLQKRPDLSLQIFMKVKHKLDQTSDLMLLEDHLVYMNLLISPLFPPLVRYRNNVLQYIMSNSDFTIQNYCILRHLISWKDNELSNVIKFMCERTDKTNEEYHYLATEIFCIENQYDNAYQHLEYVTFDENLQKYKFALYQYSRYKFRKIMNPKRKGFLQLIWNR